MRLYADPAEASVDEIVSAVPRRAGLLALTWVHSSTGVRLPIREIADAAGPDTLIVLDGVHGLATLPKVRVITPMAPALSAGIVCFAVDGMAPATVVQRLREEHRMAASVTPYRVSYARFGVLDVDEADVDAAARAVSRL